MGHHVTDKPSRGVDIVLVNSWTADSTGRRLSAGQVAAVRALGIGPRWARFVPPAIFRLIGSKGPRVVHRVDGVAKLFRGEGGQADITQFSINPLTNHTIFQSSYCENSFKEFGISPIHSSVVHNATDGSIFFPAKEPRRLSPPLKLLAVSWSPNPRKGFASLVQMADVPGVEVQFIGQWTPSLPSGQVKILGVKSAQEIAKQMRESDAFIHAAINEPCSNAIIEAMACGLPLLFKDSGSNRELAGEYGIPLTDNFVNDVNLLQNGYSRLRDNVLHDRSKFLMESAAAQYVKSFERALEH